MERSEARPKPHRGLVCAPRGVVATSQPLATDAGMRVLRGGGNALDACIAAAAVLNVVEPYNSHLGGDVFIQIYTARDRRVTAVNGSGAAPAAASLDAFNGTIPTRDTRATSVPGQVHGWVTALERFGSWPLSRLLEDAIYYAEEGFPVGPSLDRTLAGHVAELGQREGFRSVFMPQGRVPQMGERLQQPALAWTLRQLAEGGRDAFYRGEVARRIAAFERQVGGWLTEADLAAHDTEVCEPIRTTYRGLTITEQPPVSQGLILLEMLNLVEGYDFGSWGTDSAGAIHCMVEAKKLAFADRLATMGDPRTGEMPTERLIDKGYARERRKAIDPNRASVNPAPGDWRTPEDTTYLCAADAEGNAVSFIQSLFHSFGSGWIVPDLGIALNNRMTGFSLSPGHPNALAPGKRPMHTLNTFLVLDGDRLWGVGGTPGGDVQVQTNLQVLTAMIDGRLNPQEAIEMPKWASAQDGTLQVESRLAEDTLDALASKGHRIVRLGPWGMGCAVQLIQAHLESGAYLAGSDPRADGCASGY